MVQPTNERSFFEGGLPAFSGTRLALRLTLVLFHPSPRGEI